jgi:SAM-dependent methyltransferase
MADALEHDLGSQHFDLVDFMGNSVSDFPLEAAVQLVEKVETALRPGGRLSFATLTEPSPFSQVRQGARGERPRDQVAN